MYCPVFATKITMDQDLFVWGKASLLGEVQHVPRRDLEGTHWDPLRYGAKRVSTENKTEIQRSCRTILVGCDCSVSIFCLSFVCPGDDEHFNSCLGLNEGYLGFEGFGCIFRRIRIPSVWYQVDPWFLPYTQQFTWI